jgi:hypothetical protein
MLGDPKGNRTPVAGMKTQCPGPLDDGTSSERTTMFRLSLRAAKLRLLACQSLR